MMRNCLFVLLLACLAAPLVAQQTINPVPRQVLARETHRWTFDTNDGGWTPERSCQLRAAEGNLVVQCTGEDPHLSCPLDFPGGHLLLTLRARSSAAHGGQIFWTTDRQPQRSEEHSARFGIKHDGQWHEYQVPFVAPGKLTNLRLDPGGAAGVVEIDWIRLTRREVHPLQIENVRIGDSVRFDVRSDAAEPMTFSVAGRQYEAPAQSTTEVHLRLAKTAPLEPVVLEVTCEDWPPVRRTIFVHHAERQTEWIELPLDGATLRVARDGTLARVVRDGRLVAVLGPLMHIGGELPTLRLSAAPDPTTVRFQGDGVSLQLKADGHDIHVHIESEQPCEGPVVRAVGSLEQGLLAGLEYLGKGEQSSSKLDVETHEHLRFEPNPLKITMPLAAFVTDRAAIGMTWSDMSLQPTYATPNFIDCADDHRASLKGTKIDATIRIDAAPLEELIFWAVDRTGGLPPLPQPPRTTEQQWQLCLQALNGPLKNENGWGHCVEDRWPRQPFADVGSTIWRLTGEAPDLPHLAGGGSHVRNESIYFVTGRARQWLDMWRGYTAGLMRQQRPDGSFRYEGKYRRGHFENTASGVCARPAAMLLEFAYFTGDETTLRAGCRTLDYIKRFRTPRGAQVWECPLHTPDQLASAYLVWAYVRGFELTGDRSYLAEARRWAASGIPFTYLWGRYPIMLYGTPPVYGATNWRAPCWFGLPVQWVGGVYAYALTKLAPHDPSFDWNHLARGILITAEQMQFPDGPYVGLLPDALELTQQERRPWRINPCALVSLRMALDGRLDFLSVAHDDRHRVAAPFPVAIDGADAVVQAREGVDYQVIVDGRRIVDVHSQGVDRLPLD